MNFIIAGICSLIFFYTLTICYKMMKEITFQRFQIENDASISLEAFGNPNDCWPNISQFEKVKHKTKSKVDIEDSTPSKSTRTSYEKDEEVTDVEL